MRGALLLLALLPATLPAQGLTPLEQRVREAIRARQADQVASLRQLIDIPSSTLNVDGVRRVGAVYRAALDSLGFTTRWVEMPAAMHRAGHLVAVRQGRPGATRLLLIGHFDTVVEPGAPTWALVDSATASGVGGADMKGGDVIILYALKGLAAAGALDSLNLTVVITGDEEDPGAPLDTARAALIAAARASDVALAFEGGSREFATYARRGSSSWVLRVTGRQSHSAGVFGAGAGYGAIYEAARILDGFRREVRGPRYLTFNAAVMAGGTDVAFDTLTSAGTAAGKDNIVPRSAVVYGDLRFISAAQLERARARMRRVVARHLPGTDAAITFYDSYPAMSPTRGGRRLLTVLDTVSRDLGYGRVLGLDPGRRGAGDVSFVAPLIDGLDGLGAMGSGSHAPNERVDLATLPMQTERAALLMLRLGTRPAREFAR